MTGIEKQTLNKQLMTLALIKWLFCNNYLLITVHMKVSWENVKCSKYFQCRICNTHLRHSGKTVQFSKDFRTDGVHI